MFKETRLRSIIKTISWRILATLTTFLIVLIFTKKLYLALAVGGVEVVAKTVIYFFHERIWNKIHFGKVQLKPFVLWFTGLPSSGKSTLADFVAERLKKIGLKVERLDGDKVRQIFPQTGFSREERNAHIRRIGYLCSILEKNGICPLASFVSPYREARDFVRNITSNFIEVYVATPLEVCERRDIKGLYKKARSGEINQFTGVNDPYEAPLNPNITINTEKTSVEESARIVLNYLRNNKYLK